jgi:hypothetical protein
MPRILFRSMFLVAGVALGALAAYACIPPPPAVANVPATGLSLRIHVFGASAADVNNAFIAANQNTPAFHVVNQGGDGDLILGLENDSPMCAPPTGLCSFKVSYRVKNNGGETIVSNTTTITSQSDHCANLCVAAVNNVVVKVIEDAASAVSGAASAGSGEDAGAPKGGAKGKAPAKAASGLCSIASGPRLPAGEAEARAAQVEVLKRVNLLDQSEYDCLRKAYLGRL